MWTQYCTDTTLPTFSVSPADSSEVRALLDMLQYGLDRGGHQTVAFQISSTGMPSPQQLTYDEAHRTILQFGDVLAKANNLALSATSSDGDTTLLAATKPHGLPKHWCSHEDMLLCGDICQEAMRFASERQDRKALSAWVRRADILAPPTFFAGVLAFAVSAPIAGLLFIGVGGLLLSTSSLLRGRSTGFRFRLRNGESPDAPPTQTP